MEQVFEWVGIIDQPVMVKLLRDHLFPKWLRVLEEWIGLIPSMDNEEAQEDTIEEILQWYQGWKSFIPPSLMEDHKI